MTYQVSRNGQMYGPYTLEDLQRYVASGNVLATDLAKSEEMPDWVPVAQILGTVTAAAPAAAYIQPPAYGQPPAYAQPTGVAYPDAPNLHWGLVLLFGILTCGFFFAIWDLVQVLWMKRVQPNTQALMYYILFAVFWVLNIGKSVGNTMLMMHNTLPHNSILASLIAIATFVFAIVFRFSMRSSLEQHFNGPEPFGLTLSGVMTFFFGGLYFQYHLNRINAIKTALRYQNMVR